MAIEVMTLAWGEARDVDSVIDLVDRGRAKGMLVDEEAHHRKHKSGTLSITIPSGPGFCRAQVEMSPFLQSRNVPFWVCGMVAPLGRRVRSRPNSGPPMARRPEEPLPPS